MSQQHTQQRQDGSSSSSSSSSSSEHCLLHGGNLVASAIQAHGITSVFCLTGGHIAPILVGCNTVGLRVVDVRDEASAVFAADASARLTGLPGIAIVTAGPGLTNAITAVKNAQLAESPIVILAGATGTLLKGRGSLQDINQQALMESHTKWMATITRVADIGPIMQKAIEQSQLGVPGPVFVEFPLDTIWPEDMVRNQAKVDGPCPPLTWSGIAKWVEYSYISRRVDYLFDGAFDGTTTRKPILEMVWNILTIVVQSFLNLVLPSHLISNNNSQTFRVGSASFGFFLPNPFHSKENTLDRIATALEKSHHPVILLGSQATRHPTLCSELAEAIETLQCPVYVSGMARGLLGVGHTLQLRHKRSQCLSECDFVILAGVPADFRINYGRHISRKAQIVMVNLSSTTLGKNSDLRSRWSAIQGDPATFLIQLAQATTVRRGSGGGKTTMATTPSPPPPASISKEWLPTLKERDEVRDQEIKAMATSITSPPSNTTQQGIDGPFCNSVLVCQAIDNALEDNSIIVADGGDFVGTASYIVKPRGPLRWLDPGVFGTLGVGGGFAIGAKVHRPSDHVWLIYGDGSCAWSLAEMDTCVRHELPVICVIGNDACWMQMHRDQTRLLKDDVATTLNHSRYDMVGIGYGAKGILVTRNEEVAPALEQAKQWANEGHPVVINVLLAKSNFREGSISL